MPKIGDTLWTYPHGQPHRLGTRKDVISGETKHSWFLGNAQFTRVLVNKKTLLERIPRYLPRQWFTAESMASEVFIRNNRHRIAAAITSSTDDKALREIAKVLGMEVSEWKVESSERSESS